MIIIFSSYRALGVMLLGMLAWVLLASIAPHTAWLGVSLFLVGLGLLAVGRRLSRPYRVTTATGPVLRREKHSFFFIPIWTWGLIAMIVAIPLAFNPV